MPLTKTQRMGAILAGVIVILGALPAPALAATPACPSGQTIQLKSGGAWSCIISGGELTGDIIEDYNADGSKAGSTILKPNPSLGSGTRNFDANNKQIDPPTDCSGWTTYLQTPFDCFWRSSAEWFGAFLIKLASTILLLIGLLFNLAISQTILGFNAWINGSVLDAISIGWSFFRDIANIVIIGLFVFIAINIILGNKTYGERKLIARVLIVAVLINFSFLFTRVVINFSNAFAVQFARSLDAEKTYTPGGPPPDVADQFTKLMGVETLGNTKDALAKISNAQDSGWITLLHAFLTTVVLLAVALVLLYGSILLLVRALVFIFLLVTSSLAFATYLLPSLASSEFGWKAWWTALFRNALLAPLMMLFLWITLKVATALVASPVGTAPGRIVTNANAAAAAITSVTGASAPAGASAGPSTSVLGSMASSPGNTSIISSLFVYIVILGLLYGGIRLSNKLSGIAGQFALAGTLPFANAAVAWPSRSLGFLGRNTIGRGAMKVSEAFQRESQDLKRSNFYRQSMDALGRVAKRPAKASFNAGNLTNIKAAQTKRDGFEGQEKRRMEAIAAQAKRITPDNKAVEALLKENREKAAAEFASENQTRQQQAQQAKASKESADNAIKKAEEQKATIDKDISSLANKVKEINDKGARASATEINRDLPSAEQQLKSKRIESEAQSRAIEEAKRTAQAATRDAGLADAAVAQISSRIEEKAREMTKGNVNEKTGEVLSKKDRIENTAVSLGHDRLSNIIPKTLRINTEDTDKFAQKMRKGAQDYLHHEEQAKVYKGLAKEIQKITEHVDEASDKAHEDAGKEKELLKNINTKVAGGGGDH